MDVYLTSSSDSLLDLLLSSPGTTTSLDAVVRANNALGPSLNNSSALPDNKLLLLPNTDSEAACFPEFRQLERSWASLERGKQAFVREALSYHSPDAIVAFDAMLEQYGFYGSIGDTNTFAAGALGGVTQRASYFGKQIAQLELLLQDYGAAPALKKHSLKPNIRAAYAELNRTFQHDLKYASVNLETKGRSGPLRSPRQGMQRAQILANSGSKSAILGNTAQAQRILRVAEFGQIAGKGMIVVDLGLRTRNVAVSENKLRTGVSEAVGFGFSFYAGVEAYSACLGPVTAIAGPWSLAICLLPAGGAALLLDYTGKKIGEVGYDAAFELIN